MKEFEFRSAGIRVVFRGEELFLSQELLAEFEDKYVGRVSERTMQSMLVVAQNVEALRHRAKVMGDVATFNTWTFRVDTEELAGQRRAMAENSHVYLRRVRRLTDASLTWVIEFGKKGGRMHGHFVADRWMELELQQRAKDWKGSFIGRCHVTTLAAGGYMWKELGKGVGRRGTGMRLMGCMGPFAGRCTMSDFLLDSPMAECRRLAWGMRDQSARHRENHRVTWEKAAQLFQFWLAGKLSLGEEYDRYREMMAGSASENVAPAYGEREFFFENGKLIVRRVADAYEEEDQSMDASFNAEDFEQ
jgi:hypothetical protein